MKNQQVQHGALAASLLCLAAAGCQLPLALQDPMAPAQVPAWQMQGRFRGTQPTAGDAYDERMMQAATTRPQPGTQPSQPAPGDPLYAWDGGVVNAPEPGGIAPSADPSARGLEPSLQGRMHILELYQEVLDERDALQDEVDALRASLSAANERTENARSISSVEQARIAELEQERSALIEENRALVGRLTTAQIRRLETEKLLLETQIAWHDERSGASDASTPVSFLPSTTEQP